MNPVEFTNYMTLMGAQLGHLGDGRRYQLQHRVGDQWEDLLVAPSTVLCDYGTRWLREHGAVRPRGLPVQNLTTKLTKGATQ